jgi:flagellar hook-associated protein 3 FlgL
MMSGIQAYNGGFLADLSGIEDRIAQVTKEISSGTRVNQASDDPAAVGAIIGYQTTLSAIKQVQTNLSAVQAETQTADGALQAASSLLDRLVSLGASGASSTADTASRHEFGLEAQQIQQQLVDIANTAVNGKYIFGGDDSTSAPYTYDAATGNAIRNTTPANTLSLRDTDGNTIVPRMTAQAIFDLRDSADAPATGNIFAAVSALSSALLSDNQGAITSAIGQLKAGVVQLGSASTSYGNFENWLQQGSSTAADKLTNITQSLSSLRDSDVANDAMQLTLNQTALEAALAAHASLNTKSLFSYLG